MKIAQDTPFTQSTIKTPQGLFALANQSSREDDAGDTIYEADMISIASVEEAPTAIAAHEESINTVSMRQARLALLQAGLLSNVDAAIAALPSPQKEAAQITWEYATEVKKSDALTSQLAYAFGMSDQDIDTLFEVAKGL
jgi:hypothetical protein